MRGLSGGNVVWIREGRGRHPIERSRVGQFSRTRVRDSISRGHEVLVKVMPVVVVGLDTVE